jgi:hypothetical protein
MLESGTVNSDGGQAAAALIGYWLSVIGYLWEWLPAAKMIVITNNH